jgi:transposase-like protein
LFVCDMEKRSSYSAGFKLKVIDHAKEYGNWAAGHEFSVTEFNVRYWRKQKLALQNTNKSRKAFRGPKSGHFPELEDELLE